MGGDVGSPSVWIQLRTLPLPTPTPTLLLRRVRWVQQWRLRHRLTILLSLLPPTQSRRTVLLLQGGYWPNLLNV